MTLTIPQISEMHFAVTRDGQQVAWSIFVEAVSRVSSQPLNAGEGLIREALTSLYGLFNVVRETLKASPPSIRTGREPTVEHLALAMLNNELRPFLSRWHPELTRWEHSHPEQPDSDWPSNGACRADLAAMQQRLSHYILGFGRLAGLGDRNARDILDGFLGPTFPGTGRTPRPRPADQPG